MIAQGYRHLVTPREFNAAGELLSLANLNLPEGINSGLGYYEDGRLAGTAFLCGNLICGVCVDAGQRGGGLASSLVGKLVNEALEKGLNRIAIFAKADEAEKFSTLGFRLVAATSEAALLEFGHPLFEDWAAKSQKALPAKFIGVWNDGHLEARHPDAAKVCTIVMNANPFTVGHRYLAEKARAMCNRLMVFVVEEEASAFPFQLRLRLTREGLADLADVTVLPAGPYIVSRASFPAYFTGLGAHARIHAALDATIFAEKIAPAFGVTVRFVGSEPYCRVTALYNDTLKEVLPRYGLVVREIERKQSFEGALSASKVRELMSENDYMKHPERFSGLVPPSTLKALFGDEGQTVAALLRESKGSRH